MSSSILRDSKLGEMQLSLSKLFLDTHFVLALLCTFVQNLIHLDGIKMTFYSFFFLSFIEFWVRTNIFICSLFLCIISSSSPDIRFNNNRSV